MAAAAGSTGSAVWSDTRSRASAIAYVYPERRRSIIEPQVQKLGVAPSSPDRSRK